MTAIMNGLTLLDIKELETLIIKIRVFLNPYFNIKYFQVTKLY